MRFLRQSLSYPYTLSSGGVVTRLASAKSLSCLVPAGTLCPTSPSLPGGAWASLPPVQRSYATRRLPPGLPGVLRLSLVPRYLACFPRSWSSRRARGLVEAPSPRQGFWSPGPPCRGYHKEPDGSPTFPSSPCADMPRSQTPGVSCTRAKARPGLLPSSACTPSASHNDTLFGAPSRGLPARYTRLRTAPYGEARGFATDRLARRSSGRT
jgi:hypothetical protein